MTKDELKPIRGFLDKIARTSCKNIVDQYELSILSLKQNQARLDASDYMHLINAYASATVLVSLLENYIDFTQDNSEDVLKKLEEYTEFKNNLEKTLERRMERLTNIAIAADELGELLGR